MIGHERRVGILASAVLAALFCGWSAAGADGDADRGTVGVGKSALDELIRMLDEADPKASREFLKRAAARRLKVERRQVVAEIEQGLRYHPAEVAKAVALINDSPADTQRDNIRRICRAFSLVDGRFAKACGLLSAGKCDEAVAAAGRLVSGRDCTYLGAARCYLYARALAKAGRKEDAVDAWREILVNMPDRISFAAAAAAQSARLYDEMGRGLYAMEMYGYCLSNYGLTFDWRTCKRMRARIAELTKTYEDPLGSAAEMMNRVQQRLAGLDGGKETRDEQTRIVRLLADLIKTAEEKQRQGQGEARGRKKRQKQQRGQEPKQGRSAGMVPRGTRRPSSPAQRSALVPGPVRRPTKLSQPHPIDESSDWATLPPREKERLERIRERVMSQRHRHLIRDYRSRLAEGPPRQASP